MKDILTEEQIKIFLDALEKSTGKKTLLFDMDGVVCDFEKTAELWAKDMGITKQEFIDQKKYRQPNFYMSLEPIEGALESIQKLEPNFEIRFLSAPSWSGPSSFTEKRLWIEKYFGQWGYKRMDLTFRKDRFLGHFLVDDRTKYGAGKFLGEHVMYGTEPFENWNKVTEYLLAKI